jgi:hypothetical protein
MLAGNAHAHRERNPYAEGIIFRIACCFNIEFELTCRRFGPTVTSFCSSFVVCIHVSPLHFQPFLMRVSSLMDNFKNNGDFIIPTSLIPSPPQCTKDYCNHLSIILMHISSNPTTFSLHLSATCHSFASFHTSRNVWHPNKQCDLITVGASIISLDSFLD